MRHNNRFKFWIGFYLGGYGNHFCCKDEQVSISIYGHGDEKPKVSTLKPEAQALSEFWKTLTTLDLHDWNKQMEGPYVEFSNGRFTNMSVLDGIYWNLDAKIEDTGVQYAASNVYPGSKSNRYGKTFKKLLTAIEDLIGEPFDPLITLYDSHDP